MADIIDLGDVLVKHQIQIQLRDRIIARLEEQLGEANAMLAQRSDAEVMLNSVITDMVAVTRANLEGSRDTLLSLEAIIKHINRQ